MGEFRPDPHTHAAVVRPAGRPGHADINQCPGHALALAHRASSLLRYLDPTVATGWHITAPSDQLWGWGGSGSCGKCYEVSCQNKNFADGYGMALERTGVCYDEGASVIVMVTDVCPCNYPNNDYSNKRW